MPSVRQQSPWLVSCAAAIAIAAVVVVAHRPPIALVAPPDSPGVSEWIAIAIARAAHAAPVAAWMPRANAAIAVVATAMFIALARRSGISWLAAIPTALAFALSATFDPELSPLQSIGLVSAAAVSLALIRVSERRPRGAGVACVALAATAMIEPRLTIAAALVAGWVAVHATSRASRGRWLIGAGVAAAIVMGVAGLQIALPRPPPSLGPTASMTVLWLSRVASLSWRNGVGAASHVFAIAGPLAVALAALGAFVRRQQAFSRAAVPIVVFGLAPLVVAGPLGGDDTRWLAPALVGFWMLVAMGVDEMTGSARFGVRGRVLAALLVTLLPLLKLARPPEPPVQAFIPRGHDRVSLDEFKRLVAWLPDGAVVIRGDAIGDLLLRALDGTWQRMGKSLHAESPASPLLSAAVADEATPLFALPAAQAQLPVLGFQLEDLDVTGASGLARVRPGGGCAVMDARWREAPALTATTSFSLVSQEPRWDGPLVFYAESSHRLDAAPIEWPGTTSRGFGGRQYVRSLAADRALLDQAMAEDGLPPGDVHAYVIDIVRLELWHPPEAPRILVVALSDRPTRVIARIGSPAAPQSVSICPVFPYQPRGF